MTFDTMLLGENIAILDLLAEKANKKKLTKKN
jgi:hypothetical protein